MPINDHFAFVHIPKTGGHSIGMLLGAREFPNDPAHLTGVVDGVALMHFTARQMRERVRGKRFWFSIVRNPWDRAVSEYRFHGNGTTCPYHPAPLTFPEFVRFICNAPPLTPALPGYYHLLSQYDYLCDEDGRILVDRIYDFANIAAVGPELFGRPTPHSNPSPPCDFTQWYDDETEALIGRRFARDVLLARALAPSHLKRNR